MRSNNLKPKAALTPAKINLEAVRRALLRLHKVLLDDELAAYQAKNGPIEGGPTRILSLAMSDPWFDWLHSISRLVVRMDEKIEDPEADDDQIASVKAEARALVTPRELMDENEFTKRYKAALQRNAAAVLAHGETLKAIYLLPSDVQ